MKRKKGRNNNIIEFNPAKFAIAGLLAVAYLVVRRKKR